MVDMDDNIVRKQVDDIHACIQSAMTSYYMKKNEFNIREGVTDGLLVKLRQVLGVLLEAILLGQLLMLTI